MESFAGKIAVVTGGGSGMGRELVGQLAAEGCSVATCDVHANAVAETANLASAGAPPGTRVTSHTCDVADEAQVLRFRDEVLAAHAAGHVDLVFSNAGIGGGGSFIADPREQWESVFAVDFWGVYYCARAFLPLLIKSAEGVLVNTSSVNGFWASLGPDRPHTAYCAAKFAVKGFTEALITDLSLNAPHIKCSVVMPGHIGTGIPTNSRRILRGSDTAIDIPAARKRIAAQGVNIAGWSDDQIRERVAEMEKRFREGAPTTAAEAASIILDGVKSEKWRILVGKDAAFLDDRVRAAPDEAYSPPFFDAFRKGSGWRI